MLEALGVDTAKAGPPPPLHVSVIHAGNSAFELRRIAVSYMRRVIVNPAQVRTLIRESLSHAQLS